MSKNDGGAAFPASTYRPGMSLRDWFAGMALQGLLADDAVQSADGAADTAYEIADAMIAERAGE